MARYAQLNTGEVLEFPDDTKDEIMDQVVLREHRARDPNSDFGAAEENTIGRAASENIKGGITAAGDLIAGIPGMIGATPYGIKDAIQKGPEAGLETFKQLSGQLNPLAEGHYGRLPGTEALDADRESGAYHNLNKPFEMMGQGVGNIAAGGAKVLGASDATAGQAGAGGELGFGALAGLTAGYGGAKGVTGMLQKKPVTPGPDPMAAALNEAKLREQQAATDYAKGYNDLDNTMLKGGPKDKAKDAAQYNLHQQGVVEEGGNQVNPTLQRGYWDQMEHDARQAYKPAKFDVEGMKAEQLDPLDIPSKLKLIDKEPDIPTIARQRHDAPNEVVDALSKPGFQRTAEDQLAIRFWEKQKLVEAGIADMIPEAFKALDSLRVGIDDYNSHLVTDLNVFGHLGARYGLETIKGTSSNPYFRLLADKLLEDKDYNPRFEMHHGPAMSTEARTGYNAAAKYIPREHKIKMDSSMAGSERIFLHENIHARTAAALYLTTDSPKLDFPARKAANDLNKLFIAFKRETSKELSEKHWFPLSNVHEFVAEAFTSPDFQAVLASKKAPHHSNYWDSFVGAVQKLFGLDTDKFGREARTYLEQVIRAGTEVMDKADESTRRIYEGDSRMKDEFGAPPPSFKDFQKQLEAQGSKLPDTVAKAVYEKHFKGKADKPQESTNSAATELASKLPGMDKLKEAMNDERTPDQLAENLQDPNMKDINPFKRGVVKRFQPKRFAAQEHTITRWASSKIDQQRDWANQSSDKVLIGEKYEGGKRVAAEGSAMYLWQKIKDAQKEVIKNVMNDLTDMHVESTDANIQARAKGAYGRQLTAEELTAYHDRHRGMKTILKDVNEYLDSVDKPRIPELPTFSIPAEWFGDYIYFIRDKTTGEMIHPVGATFRPDSYMGKLFNRKLNAALKENGLDVQMDKYVRKDARADIDFLQIETMLRALGSTDPRAESVRKALGDIMTSMSFRKHGLQRKGYEGYQGSEKATDGMFGKDYGGLREYERVYEETVRKAYNYIANRKLDDLHNTIQNMKETEKFPQARKMALEMVDTARGGMFKMFETMDDFARDVMDFSGLPPHLLHSTIKKSNQTMVQLLLAFWLPSQIGAQFTQHLFTIPKIREEFQRAGMSYGTMNVATMKAMYSAYSTLLNPKHADITALAKEGTFEPSFRYDYLDYNYEATLSKVHKGTEKLNGIAALAFLESNVVRKPAGLMFLNMLREMGYEGKDVHRMAKQMTDSYMVSNQKYEKAGAISRTGIVGDVMGPLQSFPTTWAAQFFEYTGHAVEGIKKGQISKVDPLATFLLMNFVTAGLMGFVGVKEVDWLIGRYNDIFEKQVPTATEMILRKGGKLARIATFGAISEATGMNYGATMNAPSLQGTFAPGFQLLGNMLTASTVGARSLIGGTYEPTGTEKREALKGIAPRMFHGYIERKLTKDGEPYRTTSNRGSAVRRDEADWTARNLGTYTLKESRAKHEAYEKRRVTENLNTQRADYIERLVDKLESGGSMDEPFISRSQELQYSDSRLFRNALKKEITERMLTEKERDIKGAKSERQQRLYMLYQKLGGDR